MKKVLLFVLMIIGATFVHGQSLGKNEIIIKNEMILLKRLVSLENENLRFSKNQTAKLEGIFTDKADDINELRAKDLSKGEYSIAHAKIDEKYIPKIEKVLTTEQKIAYRKAKN